MHPSRPETNECDNSLHKSSTRAHERARAHTSYPQRERQSAEVSTETETRRHRRSRTRREKWEVQRRRLPTAAGQPAETRRHTDGGAPARWWLASGRARSELPNSRSNARALKTLIRPTSTKVTSLMPIGSASPPRWSRHPALWRQQAAHEHSNAPEGKDGTLRNIRAMVAFAPLRSSLQRVGPRYQGVQNIVVAINAQKTARGKLAANSGAGRVAAKIRPAVAKQSGSLPCPRAWCKSVKATRSHGSSTTC